MRPSDILWFAQRALLGSRARSALSLLAMGIGVAAVIVLVALGEGVRRFVVHEFAALGTDLLIVLPGRSETVGGQPPLLGETPRDLTLGDALAIGRQPGVLRVAPVVVGSAPVSVGGLEREATILGSTTDLYEVRRLVLAGGRFLPRDDPRRARPVAILGPRLARALFGSDRALGRWVRIGDRRYRVIGMLAARGQSLGVDLGEVAIIPVVAAQRLFDTESLFRILVQAQGRNAVTRAEDAVIAVIRRRHEGDDDVTVISQDALLRAFDRVFSALTLAVAGVASISLLVAGILIMNVMLVAVSRRRAEIGLIKAVGASPMQIQVLFLAESGILALAGAVCGLGAGAVVVGTLSRLFPAFPVYIPPWSVGLVLAVALGAGIVFGVLPARRAARLDPVGAFSGRA